MNEEQIKKLIQDELSGFINKDVFKSIQILNGNDIQVGRTTGTIIATEGYGDATPTDPGQKLGFFGTPAIVQPGYIIAPSGGTADTQARTAINAIISALQNLGLIQPNA